MTTIFSEYSFLSSNGETQIHVSQWVPAGQSIRGVVQIVHGIAEYGQRYDPFARFLCEQGFAVVADDHLGHGLSVMGGCPPLYIGEKDGWWHMVDDVEQLRRRTAEIFPGKPYFLFGHSMGSFLSRSHLIRYPGRLDGCILCGTAHPSVFTILGGKLAADREIARLGRSAFSARIDNLAFGSYNKKFAPNRTPSDWLSASRENVDAYLEDPRCGGEVSLGLFREMLDGLSYITRRRNIAQMNKGQPILFIAGDQDPVGDMGRGVLHAYRCFKRAGMEDVQVKLYRGLRHEILNEHEALHVYGDVLNWLERHL